VSRGGAEDAQLGKLEGTFPVDAKRLLVACVWGMVIGAVCGLIGVILAIHLSNESNQDTSYGPHYITGVLIAVGFLLPLGIVRGLQAVGRRGESFTLHENGFIHHTRRHDTVVPWSDVIDVRTRGSDRYSGFKHWFAIDFTARIHCAHGLTLKLNSMTDSAEVFCTEIERHVDAYRRAISGPQPG
jgi:hypothetical protein